MADTLRFNKLRKTALAATIGLAASMGVAPADAAALQLATPTHEQQPVKFNYASHAAVEAARESLAYAPTASNELPLNYFLEKHATLSDHNAVCVNHRTILIHAAEGAVLGVSRFDLRTLQVTGDDTKGHWEVLPGAIIAFTPNADFTGVAKAGYSLDTYDGSSITATATITVV